MIYLFSFFSLKELLLMGMVNKKCQRVCSDGALWKARCYAMWNDDAVLKHGTLPPSRYYYPPSHIALQENSRTGRSSLYPGTAVTSKYLAF